MEDVNKENVTPSIELMAKVESAMTANHPDTAPSFTEPTQPKFLSGWVDALVALMVFLVSQAVGSVLTLLIGIELPNETLTTSFDPDVIERAAMLQARFIAFTFMFSMLISLCVLWIYSRLRRRRAGLAIGSRVWGTPIRLMAGFFLMLCISVALEPLTANLPGDQDNLGGGGWLLFSSVLLAPIFEETIFRGYIAMSLRRAYGGLAAWFLSALIFGIAHLAPSVVVPAVLMGLVLGYYAIKFRSLGIAITLHAMNNLVACFFRLFDLEDISLRDTIGDGTIYWAVYGVCTLVSVVSLWRMGRVIYHIKSDNYSLK